MTRCPTWTWTPQYERSYPNLRLAQRSARATDQIASLISAIQGETNETVVAMEETTREVVAGSRLSQDAGKTLGSIESISKQLAELYLYHHRLGFLFAHNCSLVI